MALKRSRTTDQFLHVKLKLKLKTCVSSQCFIYLCNYCYFHYQINY